MTINLFDGKSHAEPIGHDIMLGLKGFLDGVWSERPIFYEEDNHSGKGQPFLKFKDDYISARNYVGFIQYRDLRINIYPRVFYNPDVFEPERAIRHVLKWLGYSRRINFPASDVDFEITATDDWLESLIFLFSRLTKDLVNNAPHFTYEETMEEMSFVRGRIAIPEYIRHNLATGRLHAVHCLYEPFVYDNLFNRVIKYTTRLLLNFTREKRSEDLLREILFTLDEVSDISCTGTDCDKIRINRLYPEMEKVRSLCKMFLHHHDIQLPEGVNGNLCLLLPMEIIFEQYIAGFIETHFPEYRSQTQASGEYLAITKDKASIPVFRMKHDILLPDRLLIDTKYKFRYRDDTRNAGVDQGDMYQMLAYCLRRNMKQGLLLYPAHQDVDAENNLQAFEIVSTSYSTVIRAGSIDITETIMQDFDKCQKEKFIQLIDIE